MRRLDELVAVLFIGLLLAMGFEAGWAMRSCAAYGAPYFRQPDGGVVAWDGGGR